MLVVDTCCSDLVSKHGVQMVPKYLLGRFFPASNGTLNHPDPLMNMSLIMTIVAMKHIIHIIFVNPPHRYNQQNANNNRLQLHYRQYQYNIANKIPKYGKGKHEQ